MLKRSHAHYVQVRAHIAITGVRRAVYVLYTGAEDLSEILPINEEFWKRAVAKAGSFLLTHGLNEIQIREVRLKQLKMQKGGAFVRAESHGWLFVAFVDMVPTTSSAQSWGEHQDHSNATTPYNELEAHERKINVAL